MNPGLTEGARVRVKLQADERLIIGERTPDGVVRDLGPFVGVALDDGTYGVYTPYELEILSVR